MASRYAEEIKELQNELESYHPGSTVTNPGPVYFPDNLCIGLFGRTGCGKTSLINSMRYAAAGQEMAGGHTMFRNRVEITRNISVVENRGMDKLHTVDAATELFAQIGGGKDPGARKGVHVERASPNFVCDKESKTLTVRHGDTLNVENVDTVHVGDIHYHVSDRVQDQAKCDGSTCIYKEIEVDANIEPINEHVTTGKDGAGAIEADPRIQQHIQKLISDYHNPGKWKDNRELCFELVSLFQHQGNALLLNVGFGSVHFLVSVKLGPDHDAFLRACTDGTLSRGLTKLLVTPELDEAAGVKLRVRLEVKETSNTNTVSTPAAGKRGYSKHVTRDASLGGEQSGDKISTAVFVFSAQHNIFENINGLADVISVMHTTLGQYPVAVITHVDEATDDEVDEVKAALRAEGVSDSCIFTVANLTHESKRLTGRGHLNLLNLLHRCTNDGDQAMVFHHHKRSEDKQRRADQAEMHQKEEVQKQREHDLLQIIQQNQRAIEKAQEKKGPCEIM